MYDYGKRTQRKPGLECPYAQFRLRAEKDGDSNLAALCSIRFYLRSGICNRLEGEDGAYEKYMKDLDQHYFIEQMGEYSTQNLTILMYQDGLHKEISKAQEIIEAVNKEYDQAFSSWELCTVQRKSIFVVWEVIAIIKNSLYTMSTKQNLMRLWKNIRNE